MRGHDAGERAREPVVRRGVVVQDGREAAPVHRDLGVRVGLDEAVPREMLAAMRHARLQQPVRQALRQHADHTRVARERTVANHAAGTVVKIEHRGEGKVHPAGAQLGAKHVACRGGRAQGAQRATAFALPGALAVVQPHLAKRRHGRQVGETIGLEALHAPALVVHADEQIVAHGLDLGREGQQLGTVLPVAREQDHAAHQRVRQARAVGRREAGAGNVDDQGGVLGHVFFALIEIAASAFPVRAGG